MKPAPLTEKELEIIETFHLDKPSIRRLVADLRAARAALRFALPALRTASGVGGSYENEAEERARDALPPEEPANPAAPKCICGIVMQVVGCPVHLPFKMPGDPDTDAEDEYNDSFVSDVGDR